MSYIKAGLFLGVLFIGGYFGWRHYASASNHAIHSLEIVGLKPNSGITKDTQITIKGYDSDKIDTLHVYLDGAPFMQHESLGKKSIDYPLTLLVKELKDGEHRITVDMHNLNKEKPHLAEVTLFFHVDTLPLQAALTKNESDGRVYQGHTLHVEFQTNKEIQEATLKTLSSSYPCYLQSNRGLIYECFVPIECEELPQEYPYTVAITDWAGNSMNLDGKFTVVAFPFKKQTIRVDKQKIHEEDSLGRPEKELEDEIIELTKKSPQRKLWHGSFIVPLELKDSTQITSDFGVIRATQERGLSQHKALDLIALPKSVVWAPQEGIVVIKDRYAHSGNTVALDHGYGLMSLFFHLDEFADIRLGDRIKKGKPVGTVGKTGYATGYHLHWEMRVNTVPVEPLEWTKPTF